MLYVILKNRAEKEDKNEKYNNQNTEYSNAS